MATTMVFGLLIAINLGYDMIIVENDSFGLILKLQGKVWLHETYLYMTFSVRLFSKSHQKGGNTVAHLVVRLLPTIGFKQVYDNNFPTSILVLEELDLS